MRGDLIPGTRSPRFSRFFAGYCRRMLRRDFAHVRITPDARVLLRSLGDQAALDEDRGGNAKREPAPSPAIVALNHASWWDPLIGLVLSTEFAPSRPLASPIESEQLRKFKFMKKLGMFGIDPSSPDAYDVFVTHVLELFEREPMTVLGLTPQGAFADVRVPVRIRPGIGAVAARLSATGHIPRVIAVSCEYTFWLDRKPDMLIHARACEIPDRPSTAGWSRHITKTMEQSRLELAELSMARDESAFQPLFESAGSKVHPVYDALLRLRGKRAEIQPRESTA